MCTILKDEQLYVDEWLEYHRFLGFDLAQLYDNADKPSHYLASLHEKYGNFVKVIHFPGAAKQIPAYAKCVKDYSKSNTWAAFIDADEFIVLRNHSSIQEFLHDVAPDGGSVVLNWSVFADLNVTTKGHEPGPVTARFIYTTPNPNQHIKTIAYLPHAASPNIHNTAMLPGYPTVNQHGMSVDSTSPFLRGNDRLVAHINHYCTKSFCTSAATASEWRSHLSKTHWRSLLTRSKSSSSWSTWVWQRWRSCPS